MLNNYSNEVYQVKTRCLLSTYVLSRKLVFLLFVIDLFTVGK